jgi:hypothetical protein
MGKSIVVGLVAVGCWFVATLPSALANDSSTSQVGDVKQALTGRAQSIGCDSPEVTTDTTTVAGTSSIVQQAIYGLQHRSWSPRGDPIQFVVKSFNGIPDDASLLVCFRWESRSGINNPFIETRPTQVDLSSDRKQLNLTVLVPNNLGVQPTDVKRLTLLPLVPFAEVRILAISKDNKLVVNAPTEIGITSPLVALFVAAAGTLLGLAILYRVRRPQSVGIAKATWLLQVISTKDGFASLSQLQVVLWTLVVAFSAMYVMAMSGRLVEITSGTLILLGIAGATGVGAAIQNGAAITNAQTTADNAAAAHIEAQNKAEQAGVATATATDTNEKRRLEQIQKAAEAETEHKKLIAETSMKIAKRLTQPPADQTPSWSDLLVNQIVTDHGVETKEIDVTRFQMLLFTLVTAFFVLITVMTTYIIPEIPSGFVTLMGISNGVYLGAKVIHS